MKKIKLLFFGDSPTCSTGFGIVAKNILAQLQATGKYDITILGINHYGDPHNLPYKIYPAGVNNQGDVYGRQRLLDLLRDKNFNFDILFTLQDTFIMATIGELIKKLRDGVILEKDGKKIFQKGRGFKWVYYYPIDAVPEKEWIEKSVKLADIAVPYTYYAKDKSKQCVARDYKVIYHGVDDKIFYPMSEEEKNDFSEKFFKDNNLKNSFLIVNVNRNQERKALVYTLLAFKIFRSIVPGSVLYTHCDVENDRGGNLLKIAARLGIRDNWLYPNPKTYKDGYSFSASYINGIYNLANINISTTLGEGWGLSCSESMACKTLNIFPNNTSLTEILADNRGLLYKSGEPPTQIIMNGPLDNSILRPMPNVEDLVEKMLWAYSHPDACNEMTENAYHWIKENILWENIGSQWDQLITNLLKK
jgi:glycosyltransferase involved in cell wall biosynthesis